MDKDQDQVKCRSRWRGAQEYQGVRTWGAARHGMRWDGGRMHMIAFYTHAHSPRYLNHSQSTTSTPALCRHIQRFPIMNAASADHVHGLEPPDRKDFELAFVAAAAGGVDYLRRIEHDDAEERYL